jgi:archaellum biogenesis ATPase FlaH
VKEWKDATRYVLEECPFDSNHKAPDATIIKMRSGAICFKCLHNSCSGRDWRELRLKYEPDAYDDKTLENDARIEEGYRKTKETWKGYKSNNRYRDDLTYEEKMPDTEHPEKMFESPLEIFNKRADPRILIKTGLNDFDRKTGGLAKGEISLVSGLRGSAKSTWLSQVAINVANTEKKVVFYSGELKDKRFMEWMTLQIAGSKWTEQDKSRGENFWHIKDNGIKRSISEWLDPYFLLYNNDYGSNFKQITAVLKDLLKNTKADFVIIDNMSILDLSDITSDRRADKWDQQKIFVETLKNLAMLCECHIIFVAHPRKAAGFLRLDDVGGSGALGNLVDNAFIVHRVNRDFRKGYKRDILGLPENAKSELDDEEEAREKYGDNCIEIVKERETGIQDLFIPLWYEKESKRLLNYPGEDFKNKWNEAHEKSPWT